MAKLGYIGDDFIMAYESHKRSLESFERLNTPTEQEIQPVPLKQLESK